MESMSIGVFKNSLTPNELVNCYNVLRIVCLVRVAVRMEWENSKPHTNGPVGKDHHRLRNGLKVYPFVSNYARNMF